MPDSTPPSPSSASASSSPSVSGRPRSPTLQSTTMQESVHPGSPRRPGRRRWLFACVIPLVLVLILGSSHHSDSSPISSIMASVSVSNLKASSFTPPSHLAMKAHALSWIPSQLRRRYLPLEAKRSPEVDAHEIPSRTPIETPTSTIPIPLVLEKRQANAGSSNSPPIPATPWPVPTPFPQPWDTSLSYNFSQQSCLSFFTNTLANNTFRACRAFSLLLPTSSAFFKIEGNLTELTATVGGTCDTSTSAQDCQGIMDYFASEIAKPTVCAQDLANKHPIAQQALTGFQSYTIMRNAGCLINQRTNAYCFVDAVASTTNPSDLYYYSLPLGTSIPSKSTPSCSACVQSLMALFASYATNSSLSLHDTYPDAAKMANAKCGDSYAPPLTSFNHAGPSRTQIGSALGLWIASLLVGIIGSLIGTEAVIGFG